MYILFYIIHQEEITYRFEVTSLSNNEGWIIGKPAIMLHTRDGGKQFERIPLSPKLPGDNMLFYVECVK